MKNIIFIASISTFLFSAGCTTTYLSLTENNKEQIEQKLSYDEREKDVGAEITISIKNGEEINGELLSVRDSTITLCTEYSATEEELAKFKYSIITVRNDEIQELTIEGSSYVWTGLFIGIGVGTGIGVIIGRIIERGDSSSDEYEGLITAGLGMIGFITGAIAGPTVGYSHSTEEFILQEIPPGYDMTFLKPLARYPDEEPKYLRAIK